MKKSAKAVLALASVATLALSACGSTGGVGGAASAAKSAVGASSSATGGTTTTAQWNNLPRDQVKDGGTYTYAIGEITPQLNVFQADMTADTGSIWQWYNPVPTYSTPEGVVKTDPNWITGSNVTTDNGNTVLTIDINPKAKWNDGSDIDWHAYEAAWKTCGEVNADAFNCNSTDGLNKISSVKQGKDAKEAVITFKGAFVWWDSLLGDMVNPHLTDPDTFNKGYTNNQAHPEWGAGPYKLDSIDQAGGTVTFVKNDKWWGDPGKLDKIVLKVLDQNAQLNAFKNGQLDVFDVINNKDFLQQVQGMQGVSIYRAPRTYTNFATLNSNSDKLKDVNVRKAIFEGVDRSVISNIMFQGLDYSEKQVGSMVMFPFQQGYADNATAAGISYNAAQANKDLDAAGWAKGSDGIRAKDGTKLSLHLPIFSDTAQVKSRATALQAMMKQIGVDIVIDQKASSDFSKVISAKDFDMLMSSAGGSQFGIMDECQFYCLNATLNKSGTNTKEIDAMVNAIPNLPTKEAQIDAGNKAEVAAFKQAGILPLYLGPDIVVTKKGLANVGSTVFGGVPIQDIGWGK